MSDTTLSMSRYDRWNSFFEVWSKSFPDGLEDWEFSSATATAFAQFEKQDAPMQAAMIARAWGIVPKIPARRQRKSPATSVVIPPPPRWEPCVKWGGTRPCSDHAHTLPDTAMRTAQSMFEKHAKFVRQRIRVEHMILSNKDQWDITDLESAIWFNVAARIESYKPQETLLAWLRSVVHTTVVDVVRDSHRQKRDVRKEVPLPDYAVDKGIPNPAPDEFGLGGACPAKPTPTAEMRNFMRENEFESQQIVAKMAS